MTYSFVSCDRHLLILWVILEVFA